MKDKKNILVVLISYLHNTRWKCKHVYYLAHLSLWIIPCHHVCTPGVLYTRVPQMLPGLWRWCWRANSYLAKVLTSTSLMGSIWGYSEGHSGPGTPGGTAVPAVQPLPLPEPLSGTTELGSDSRAGCSQGLTFPPGSLHWFPQPAATTLCAKTWASAHFCPFCPGSWSLFPFLTSKLG